MAIIKKTFYLNPSNYNLEIYIPDGATKKLPCLFFIPGNGERGTDANKLYVHGPLKFIKDGWRPPFIVVGFQPSGPWGNFIDVQRGLDEILKPEYQIDRDNIFLTGLSGGAAALGEYIKMQADERFVKIRGVIPMSITMAAQCGDFYQKTDVLCKTDLRYKDISVWGISGSLDSHTEKFRRFIQLMIIAGYDAKFTEYKGGHSGWNTFYDPKYKDSEGESLYDWMMKKVSSVTPETPAPTPNPIPPTPQPTPITVVEEITIQIMSDGTKRIK